MVYVYVYIYSMDTVVYVYVYTFIVMDTAVCRCASGMVYMFKFVYSDVA